MRRVLTQWAVLIMAIAAWAGAAQSQEILLDRGFKAGELTVFPIYGNEKTFYYVPDKARLAVDENNQPQFSFLKFVSNVASEAGEKDNDEGEGGGIVHCLVQLGATPEQVSDAQAQVRRKVPGATLAGPVIFKSGKFGIVSSFKQDNGDLATKVLGIGNAPILDGEKAAVSIRLTKFGAKVLWQSFKTATPDISFTFEMEMSGYRNPYEARLEANFDQIFKHREFSGSLAANLGSVFVGGQIRDIFDELKTSGAIKLVTKGDDAKLDTLVSMAYGKICDLMFDKMESGPGSSSGGENQELLNRATDVVLNQRQALVPDDERGRLAAALADYEDPLRRLLPISADYAFDGYAPRKSRGGARVQFIADTAPRPRVLLAQATGTTGTGTTGTGTTGTGTTGTGATGTTGSTAPTTGRPTTVPMRNSEGRRAPATDLETQTPPASATSGQTTQGRTQPSFSLLASYQMKTVHRSGVFKLEFNKFSLDTLQLRFDENIGDLSRLMNDKRHFFEVNLDDPVFKQREISVYLDGQNAADFDKYVNYVTVRMRKKHEGGDETDDEVRIDRANFNKNGNFFKLLYGWKDDKSRDKWMNYEYNEVWSFHGGKEVDLGWKSSRNFTLTVTPPFEKRILHLEADPAAVQAAGVRLISAKVYYDLGGTEQMKQITLNPAGGQLSQVLEYVRPANKNQYAYEISWRMKDGRTLSSGRKTSEDEFIFCDELPTGAAGGGQ